MIQSAHPSRRQAPAAGPAPTLLCVFLRRGFVPAVRRETERRGGSLSPPAPNPSLNLAEQGFGGPRWPGRGAGQGPWEGIWDLTEVMGPLPQVLYLGIVSLY